MFLIRNKVSLFNTSSVSNNINNISSPPNISSILSLLILEHISDGKLSLISASISALGICVPTIAVSKTNPIIIGHLNLIIQSAVFIAISFSFKV